MDTSNNNVSDKALEVLSQSVVIHKSQDNNEDVINDESLQLSQPTVSNNSIDIVNGNNTKLSELSQYNDDIAIIIDNEEISIDHNNPESLSADERENIQNNIIPVYNKLDDVGAINLEMQKWYSYANKI